MEYLLRCAMVDTRVLLRGCTRWLVQRRHSAASPEWLVGLLTPLCNHWLCSNTLLSEWLVGLLTPLCNHWLRSHTFLSEWLVVYRHLTLISGFVVTLCSQFVEVLFLMVVRWQQWLFGIILWSSKHLQISGLLDLVDWFWSRTMTAINTVEMILHSIPRHLSLSLKCIVGFK